MIVFKILQSSSVPIADEPKSCFCILVEPDIVARFKGPPRQWHVFTLLNFNRLNNEFLKLQGSVFQGSTAKEWVFDNMQSNSAHGLSSKNIEINKTVPTGYTKEAYV